MPRCQCCHSTERKRAEKALANGATLRAVAGKFNLSEDSYKGTGRVTSPTTRKPDISLGRLLIKRRNWQLPFSTRIYPHLITIASFVPRCTPLLIPRQKLEIGPRSTAWPGAFMKTFVTADG